MSSKSKTYYSSPFEPFSGFFVSTHPFSKSTSSSPAFSS
jgi:hypothetical protein